MGHIFLTDRKTAIRLREYVVRLGCMCYMTNSNLEVVDVKKVAIKVQINQSSSFFIRYSIDNVRLSTVLQWLCM